MIDQAPGPEAKWRAAAAKVLRGADPETLVRLTADAIPLRPLYPAAERSTAPARAPGRWRMSQRVDHPDPAQANGLALADLDGGADGLTLVMADAPSARGFGLRLHSAEDLERVLDGVQLEPIELRLDPGPHGVDCATWLAEAAGRRGGGLTGLDLDLGIDPAGLLAVAGSLPADWVTTADQLADSFRRLRAGGFRGRFFRADGRPWADAGASEAQELAAVLAAGVLYLRALEANGSPLDAARDALSFTLSADADLILTVAKFRALRSLWARIEEASGLRPQPIRLHGETAWRMMTVAAPETNVVRGTIAGFAAAVGGADAITVLPFTLARTLPDAFARRLARNSQHVLADEAHLWRVPDPAAGAGAFEAATLGLCQAAWRLFQEIEREGGIVSSLVAGQVQRRVAASAKERRDRLADGRDSLVGVTMFRQEDGQAKRNSEVLRAPAGVDPLGSAPPQSAAGTAAIRAEVLVSSRAAQPFEDGPGSDAGEARGHIP